MIKNGLIYLFISLLNLLFVNLYIHAQENGKPFMQIYSNIEYAASLQNWCIIEDKRGMIYVANNDYGVLEFDGTNWRHISTTNLSITRSLALGKNGTIYVGGVNEFGYLAPDRNGILKYNSLTHLISPSLRSFEDIWSLNVLEDQIIFQSRETIFIYKDHEIRSIKVNDCYHRGFVVNNNYYIRQEGIGLTVLEADTFHLVEGSSIFSQEFISAMMPFLEHKILIGSRTKGLFLFNEKKNSIRKFPNDANEFLSKNMLYHGTKVEEDKFAFATLRNGIIIIDKYGKINQYINKNNGLPTSSVYFIHNQNNESLWLGMQRNVARIDIGYPMVYWNEDFGIDGTIFDIEKINNIFYIGTVQSVSYWVPKSNNHKNKGEFKQIDGISSYVWDLFKYKVPCKNKIKDDYKLIVAANEGLYEIQNLKAKLIAPLKRNQRVYCPQKNPFIIFIGSDDGLYHLKYDCKTNKWHASDKLLQIPDNIIYINEDKNNNIWLATSISGYYKISFERIDTTNLISNYSFNSPHKIENFYTENGFPKYSEAGLLKADGELIFLSDSGLFKFNEETKLFYPLSNINKQLSNILTTRSIQDSRGDIWIDGQEHLVKQPDNSYKSDPSLLKRIEIFDIKTTFNEKENTIWFGENNLYKLNSNKTINVNRKYPTLIRKVFIDVDSLIFGGTYFNESRYISLIQTNYFKPTLDYQFNSIIFEYSSPYFIEQNYIQYSYKLMGYDKSWSEWSKETKKEYTNLPEGNYMFRVKAKNIFNVESTIDSYQFKILHPWYRSIFAYIGYLILLGCLIFTIVKINSKRLKQANLKLENIIKERTKEILKKNKELAELSIVAKETDNAIVIMDAEGNYEWFNDAHKRIFGYEYNDFVKNIGDNILTVSTNKDIKKVIEDCIKNKKPAIYESSGKSLNGRKFWTQVTLSPVLSQNGEVEKLITIEADIRRIKEYEKELANQRDELAEANATKDRFFSIIAHDLKSPFNAVLGFAEMLDENISTLSKEKIAKFNNQILTAARQLYNLVENLLSWSRAKSGKLESYPTELSINQLVEDACAVMIISADKKNINIFKEIPPDLNVFVDADIISLVLRNILSNAIKYSSENNTVTIKVKNIDKYVEISISDTGVGIKKENINKLFKENIHFTTQGTKQEKGTGLGLLLCKDFIEKSNGKIWVDSEFGVGTTFTFTLPKPGNN